MTVEETELSFMRCPECRSLVPSVATSCRMCGYNFEKSAESEAKDDVEGLEDLSLDSVDTDEPVLANGGADTSNAAGAALQALREITAEQERKSANQNLEDDEDEDGDEEEDLDEFSAKGNVNDEDDDDDQARSGKRRRRRRKKKGRRPEDEAESEIHAKDKNEGRHDKEPAKDFNKNTASKPSSRSAVEGALIGWMVSFAKDKKGVATELRAGRFFISGQRLRATDIVVSDDTVSAPHLLVSVEVSNGVRVQDLMSEHGTYIKRQGENSFSQVSDAVTLKHGDSLRMGEYEFMVCLVP